jgi:hypothetical protein
MISIYFAGFTIQGESNPDLPACAVPLCSMYCVDLRELTGRPDWDHLADDEVLYIPSGELTSPAGCSRVIAGLYRDTSRVQ